MSGAAVLTISDSRSQAAAEDRGGPAVERALIQLGINVTHKRIIPDEIDAIRSTVQALIGQVALIVTTGGTGVSDRDVTPEAIAPLLEKQLPGFGEIMRTETFAQTPLSIISRGGAGIAGHTLIIMLPGSPRGAVECLNVLAPAIRHVLTVLEKQTVDCQSET